MFRVKHVMTAWMALVAVIFIGIVVVAPVGMMFLNGVPSAGDFGNYLFLFVLACPIGIIVTMVVGLLTFPIAVLLCAKDVQVVGVCVSCGYDMTGNLTGVCPECGGERGNGQMADGQMAKVV